MDALQLYAHKQKQLLRCDICQDEIDRREGYRFLTGKLLCNNCHAGHVVELRRKERDERQARNVLTEG